MPKMKTTIGFLIIVVLTMPNISSADRSDAPKTALLLIDIQDFYFPGGALPLKNPAAASLNAKRLLEKFRSEKRLVIHVRHNAKAGAGIHESVAPEKGEKVISKNYANSFRDTDLLDFLKANKVTRLVICGMQTHMCVEAAVRAAADYGFECILVHDACAARDLKFNDKIIEAEEVHNATLASLSRTYARVIDCGTFLKE